MLDGSVAIYMLNKEDNSLISQAVLTVYARPRFSRNSLNNRDDRPLAPSIVLMTRITDSLLL